MPVNYATIYGLEQAEGKRLFSQRFLMVKLEQRMPTPVTELILVQNWFEEFKRIVSAGK